MKTRTKIIISSSAVVLFVIWIMIIKTVDVKKYTVVSGGTDHKEVFESEVGLYEINSSFHDLWSYDSEKGYNVVWYEISRYTGYLCFGVIGALGLFGILQLIKRKSLFKMDKCMIALGVLYVVTIGFYVFFEFVTINKRPILLAKDKELAASFPSSHTLLIIVVLGSLMLLLKNYIDNKTLRISLQFLCLIIIVTAVFGRLICGVHWFSDIIGGMLLSLGLLSAFSVFNEKDMLKKVSA